MLQFENPKIRFIYNQRMTLKQALAQAVETLTRNDVGSPRMNAEVLLMFVLNCDRAYLYAHSERELSEAEATRYDECIARRSSGIPSQYITGHQEFWGLDLIVSPAVLIPRPETEHIIEVVLELLKQHPVERPRIVDVGTGSGAIALALAQSIPSADVLAVDLSREALDLAQANAARLQLERVRFAQSDVLTNVDLDASFDFVVSNPPYVALSEADKVQDVVKKFEPKMAVFAGEHGLDVIQKLIPQSRAALKPGGWIVMEIGFSMSEAVMALLSEWNDVHAVPDLAGIPRVIVARKP
ncbi:MAG TPA: peptide chain release factor N(5)-glutamine methyltransferase [candidate division Zixibacteria bacterium]|nr:peptide chain release factor N(5)-glutamine methyltransferase [candidate division Zixibacteria bacterium]